MFSAVCCVFLVMENVWCLPLFGKVVYDPGWYEDSSEELFNHDRGQQSARHANRKGISVESWSGRELDTSLELIDAFEKARALLGMFDRHGQIMESSPRDFTFRRRIFALGMLAPQMDEESELDRLDVSTKGMSIKENASSPRDTVAHVSTEALTMETKLSTKQARYEDSEQTRRELANDSHAGETEDLATKEPATSEIYTANRYHSQHDETSQNVTGTLGAATEGIDTEESGITENEFYTNREVYHYSQHEKANQDHKDNFRGTAKATKGFATLGSEWYATQEDRRPWGYQTSPKPFKINSAGAEWNQATGPWLTSESYTGPTDRDYSRTTAAFEKLGADMVLKKIFEILGKYYHGETGTKEKR